MVAASREARESGIKQGMAAEKAKVFCPHLLLKARDYTLEALAWAQVRETIYAYTPFLEATRPPFAFFSTDDPQDAATLARVLQARCGVAERRAYAMLGAVRAPERCVLQVSDLSSFLGEYPLHLLPELGFSEDIIDHLKLLGLKHVRHVRNTLTKRHLTLQFGKEGDRLYRLLHPKQQERIQLFKPTTIYRCQYFDTPGTEPGQLVPVLHEAAGDAAEALQGRVAGSLQVCVQLFLGSRHCQARLLSKPLSPAGISRQAEYALMMLLERLGRADTLVEVEEMSVELGAIAVPPVRQLTFFDEKANAVEEAIRTVHRRYPGAILRAQFRPNALLHEHKHIFIPWPLA